MALRQTVSYFETMALDLEAARAFIEVAAQGSFTKAASALNVSKSRVSLAVSALEKELGGRLLLRTTRAVRLTPEGEQLLPRAQRLVHDADQLSALFAAPSSITGRLRVDLPVTLARDVIIPRLPEFCAAHPLLELQVSVTDRLVDVLRDGFDCVLRVGVLTDSSLNATRLGVLPMMNCASAAYLQRYGVPESLRDLESHYVVHYAHRLGEEEPVFAHGREEKPMRALITVNNVDAYHAACLAGFGIGQVGRVSTVMTAALANGTVREVLPRFTAPALPVSLVHGYGRSVPRRVRAFMAWLQRLLKPTLK